MIPAQSLIDKVHSYAPEADGELIRKAYEFGLKAHGTQKRASGELYFSHPIEVAYSLTDFKLDTSTIITALLHDVVEDTPVTLEDLEEQFGAEVRQLVDGVTKLSRIEGKSENMKQAENFRKLLVALSEDLRVLLVKLMDRLHNMQTLRYIKSEDKRKRIAYETLEIYASLAERIGMRNLKDELQDLAFAELYPEARESIVKRLEFLREEGAVEVKKTQEILRQKLIEGGVTDAEISGREKKPYSIWKKMESKNVSFEQLADIIAFRIIVPDLTQCYQALGVIHSTYHTVPGHFKDYISTPKSNGYQSLHTAVIGPARHRIEVQIRSRELHEIAENGLAAHWSYKQGTNPAHEGKQFRWVRELLDILERSSGPEEFLEHTKLEMYHDQVFCFTPKGDIIALPRGSTPVDFAYAVHSAVGDTCVGAKINGRIVPLRTPLKNGNQVDIITSKTQTPSPSWERFVVTGKARSEIRKYVRTQQRTEYVNLGKAILAKTLKAEGVELTDKMIEPIVESFNKKTVEDLYAELGEGLLSRQQVQEAILGKAQPKQPNQSSAGLLSRLRKRKANDTHTLPIKGLIPGMAIHYARCCHPIPGDRIVGIVTTGKGITIHTIDCETLENYSDSPERWIDVGWEAPGGKDENTYVGRLRAHISHEPSALATVTSVIAKELGNINNLKIVNRSIDFFEILLDIEVRDVRHLNNIIANLRSKDTVQSVERYSS